MDRRRIQLIAGSTYSVSLPKAWVVKRGLRRGSEVQFHERGDGTLVLSPQPLVGSAMKEASLDVDEHGTSIDHVLFALYYLGVEDIHLSSPKGLAKDVKLRIRRALAHMSGTEITYEDQQRMTIRVLLDRSKVDVRQLLYRMGLIIELTIAELSEATDSEEVAMNENEIDRLYHLMTKTISLSLVSSDVLLSSGIGHSILVPSYLLISKKLENIADRLGVLGERFRGRPALGCREPLLFVRTELGRSVRHITHSFKGPFRESDSAAIRAARAQIRRVKDVQVADCLEDMVRFLLDIQQEIISLSFYTSLIAQGKL